MPETTWSRRCKDNEAFCRASGFLSLQEVTGQILTWPRQTWTSLYRRIPLMDRTADQARVRHSGKVPARSGLASARCQLEAHREARHELKPRMRTDMYGQMSLTFCKDSRDARLGHRPVAVQSLEGDLHLSARCQIRRWYVDESRKNRLLDLRTLERWHQRDTPPAGMGRRTVVPRG